MNIEKDLSRLEVLDWSEITEIEADGERFWITEDSQAHYDLKSAEERRNELVAKFQTKGLK